MSGEPTHLRAVDAPAAEAEATPPAEAPRSEEPTPSRRWLVPVLVVAVVACAAGWFWQARGAAALEAQLATTEAALAASEARVGALEAHLGAVQDRFAAFQSTLQSELDALGGLLESDPGEGSPEAR